MIVRRRYIDWARGAAVLIMLQTHSLDAWTRPADRQSATYVDLTMVGGLGAPLFLWLAGIALVLAAESQLTRTGDRRAATAAIIRRGAEIFILAFLFRLQAFIVSPGSWLITIFRVDILNVMGPAIALTGVVWGVSRGRIRAAAACGVVAVLIAMLTPVIRAAGWVDSLPLWFQWNLRPFGDHTTFTLLPWAGFVFAGAACGGVLAKTDSAGSERRRIAGLTVAGGLLIWVGLYTATLPSIYRESSFWTSSPTYFIVRLGVMLVILGALFAMSPLAAYFSRPFGVLERFGRNSLFIYWIHVELVYGYATWPLRRSLPLWGWFLAYVVFASLMYAAIGLRDRIVGLRRTAQLQDSTVRVNPARV